MWHTRCMYDVPVNISLTLLPHPRVHEGDREIKATGDSIIMDLVVVSVATALGVRIKVDEVVEGEGVGGAAQTGPTTRRGGATKSDRGSGLTPEVSMDSRACVRQGTRMNWLVMVDDWPQYTAGSGCAHVPAN